MEERIRQFVITLFENSNQEDYPYHNIDHTKLVVLRAKEISHFYGLDKDSMFITTAAAWFHDTGYLNGGANNHEERSVEIMKKFLQGVPAEITNAIALCILATKIPTHPVSLPEKILCDADTYHLGTVYFRQTNVWLGEELKTHLQQHKVDWIQVSIHFLQSHTYYTYYCRQMLEQGVEDNIKWLRSL